MYLYIYLVNYFYYFILYQYMCITLNVYINSTIEYYCINIVLWKFINIYIIWLYIPRGRIGSEGRRLPPGKFQVGAGRRKQDLVGDVASDRHGGNDARLGTGSARLQRLPERDPHRVHEDSRYSP